MADILDFLPILQENANTVRARVDADANFNLDPFDPAYIDTTPGGFYYDITQAVVLEMVRLWDTISVDMVAASLPSFAWGAYLDEHGVTVNLTRKDASKALGILKFTGPGATLVALGTQVSTLQTDPDEEAVVFQTTQSGIIPGGPLDTGEIELTAEAVGAGTDGNVGAGTIQVVLSPVAGDPAVTNDLAFTGGEDVETDARFRERILLEFQGAHGAGTIGDYERWGLAWPGVGHVKVTALWNGAGTVKVTVTDVDNKPVAAATVDGLQGELDPVAGKGEGLAPIGAIVTVATPTAVLVTVSAAVTFESGYSLDGTGATVATREDIEDAIRGYIDVLPPGDDVVLNHVSARFFLVPGVADVANLLLNGTAANVAMSDSQVAETSTITLT